MENDVGRFEVFEKISVKRNLDIMQKRMAELRREKNMTQLQMSYQMDVSRSSIASWENGNRIPDASRINDMAHFYDVTPDYLLGLVDEKLGKVERKIKLDEKKLAEK